MRAREPAASTAGDVGPGTTLGAGAVTRVSAWLLFALLVVMWFVTDPFSAFSPPLPDALDLEWALVVSGVLAVVSVGAHLFLVRPFLRVHDDVWVLGYAWHVVLVPVDDIAALHDDHPWPRLETTESDALTVRAVEQTLAQRMGSGANGDLLFAVLHGRARGPAPQGESVARVTWRVRRDVPHGSLAMATVWAVLLGLGLLLGDPPP